MRPSVVIALSFLVVACGDATVGPDCEGAGLVRCGDACVDRASDAANCGNCGQACASGASCVSGSCVARCAIDGGDVAAGVANARNPCLVCDPAVSHDAWSRVPDGQRCGEEDSCFEGECRNACVIDGALVASASASPGNACLVCRPSSGTQWTELPAGSACGTAQVCASGDCRTGCFIDGGYVEDGFENPANACERCDAERDTHGWSPGVDGASCGEGQVCAAGTCGAGCFIDGAFVADGAFDPANACVECDPSTSTTAWTPVPTGTTCGEGRICSAGTCTAGCFVDGVFVAAGAPDPANACLACAPGTSTVSFSPRADGTACGAGEICSGNACVAGCLIQGAFFAAGALNPANDCEACDPATTTSAWNVRPDRSVCGVAQYCSAGACGPTWHSKTFDGLPAIYGGPAAASPDGRIFLFGGFGSTGPWNDRVRSLDPATGVATQGAVLPYQTYWASAVTGANGLIYVFGGVAVLRSPPTAATYAYDPANGTFTAMAPMPAGLAGMAAALGHDGRIYAFGADDAATAGAEYTVGRTHIYDPATNAWTTGAPMPTLRQYASAVTLPDGRIAVVGGNRGYIPGLLTGAMELYAPATNTWTSGPALPEPSHTQQAALRADERLVVTSGAMGTSFRATYVFDPATSTWAAGTPTASGHYAGPLARTPDGRLYFIAGRDSPGNVYNSTVDVLDW